MKELLYIQVSEDIRAKIRSGEIPYGTRLPSERTLAEAYQIDRKTLRKAISLLSEEGVLLCLQGKGTYIVEPQIAYQVERMDDLEQMILRNGMKSSTRVLYKEVRKAGRKYAELLDVSPEERVFRMLRLRMGNEEPIALMDTYVRCDMVADIETLDFEMYSLYGVLNQNGIEISKIDESFMFYRVSNPEAQILRMEEGEIAFITEDKTYDQYGRIVEYTKSVINNQKFSIDVSFNPDK